ncbi:MAG: type II toxin-antitoxin system VapB family antitoxin [Deltaproteobacteria bacterium]|nr:type II toxin-antitoxin system VapB family antitoxin [Deltaproteobacteria bacterium]
MPLSIKNNEVEQLARELAKKTGESITAVLLSALKDKLRHEQERKNIPNILAELEAIRKRCAKYTVLDNRSTEDILGYDENGLPH